MTKKKSKEPEEFDYAEFCIKITKLCMKLFLKFSILVYSLSTYTYKKIKIWLAERQLKKDVKECATDKNYFREDDPCIK